MNFKRRIAWIAVLFAAILAVLAGYWSPPARISRAGHAALEQLGKPYIFGAAGPESFDCSGLMLYAYGRVGVTLVHNTKAVAGDERYRCVTDPARLRPGDLVFFDTISGGSDIDHVGFWLGGNRFVHASSAKGEVIVSAFDERWRERFTLAKRVL